MEKRGTSLTPSDTIFDHFALRAASAALKDGLKRLRRKSTLLIQEKSMKNLAVKDLQHQVIKRLQGIVQYL